MYLRGHSLDGKVRVVLGVVDDRFARLVLGRRAAIPPSCPHLKDLLHRGDLQQIAEPGGRIVDLLVEGSIGVAQSTLLTTSRT